MRSAVLSGFGFGLLAVAGGYAAVCGWGSFWLIAVPALVGGLLLGRR